MRDGGILNDVAISREKDGRIDVGAIHKPPESPLRQACACHLSHRERLCRGWRPRQPEGQNQPKTSFVGGGPLRPPEYDSRCNLLNDPPESLPPSCLRQSTSLVRGRFLKITCFFVPSSEGGS